MSEKHKHAEYIKAWLDGETVEVRTGGGWYEVESLQDFDHCCDSEFRKKPTHWYRVGLFKWDGGYFVVTTNTDLGESDFPDQEYFVRWLTDRVYYEV